MRTGRSMEWSRTVLKFSLLEARMIWIVEQGLEKDQEVHSMGGPKPQA